LVRVGISIFARWSAHLRVLANTSPLGSRGVIGFGIVVPVLPVALQVPLDGSYSSEGVLMLSPMAST
jgi:hypothetical protein